MKSQGTSKAGKKLYLLTQDINNGYDTYDSCVVCARSRQEARLIHPCSSVTHNDKENWYGTYTKGGEYITEDSYPSWVLRGEVDKIKIKYIGIAKKNMKVGLVVASYNAG